MVVVMMIMRKKMMRINRFGLHEIECTLPWKQLTSAGSKVQGGVGLGGQVGG